MPPQNQNPPQPGPRLTGSWTMLPTADRTGETPRIRSNGPMRRRGLYLQRPIAAGREHGSQRSSANLLVRSDSFNLMLVPPTSITRIFMFNPLSLRGPTFPQVAVGFTPPFFRSSQLSARGIRERGENMPDKRYKNARQTWFGAHPRIK
jgi:hypothetical protein